jgi:hypothetical protein
MFFSEEKNQKTFAPTPAENEGHDPYGRSCTKEIKVFWFFSSEKNMLSSAFALTLCLATGAQAADEPPPLPVGYDTFRMWDRWPSQRIGERAYMRSTYDRAGGNEAADASHFLYQLADDRNVTLDVEGPGILYFVRTNRWHGSPWHYVADGTDHIVTETNTADPLHPTTQAAFVPAAAFPGPLALTWGETKGADLSWVPIGFEKSFRMEYGRTFYGTGYYIYDQFVNGTKLSRPIRDWDGGKPPQDVLNLIGAAGTDVAPPAGTNNVVEQSGRLDLPAHGLSHVWTATKAPSVIRALELSVPRAEALAFSNVRLRVTWDNRAAPSINAPVALFFGAGLLYNRDNREYLVKSFPMVIRYGRDRVFLRCYFPMPFFRAARIDLAGVLPAPITDVQWKVRYEPFEGSPSMSGYFHASYRDHDHTHSPGYGADLVLLDTRKIEGGGDWSGSLVGTSFIFSDNADLATLEGDPRFFFDDSQTPQAQGTGTEEWGGGGDYWGGQTTTLPFAGHPIGAESPAKAVSPEDKVESAYRFLLSDLMPFGRNALIQLEHGGEDQSTEHYQTVTYWYGLPAASLIRTDELAIGDATSENQHRYVSPDASPPTEITSRYEWGPDRIAGTEIYPASTDRGRTTSTSSEFTLRIDPNNLGVLLRRKLDYSFPNQRAEIYVANPAAQNLAWDPAGVWYLAGSNTSVFSAPADGELGGTKHVVEMSNRRFRDDEFLIPRALTAGRRAIRIRIVFTSVRIPLYPTYPPRPLAWSELRYSAYSYIVPSFAP